MRVFALYCLLICCCVMKISAVCSNLDSAFSLLRDTDLKSCNDRKKPSFEVTPNWNPALPVNSSNNGSANISEPQSLPPPPLYCAAMARISWLERPPMVYNDTSLHANSSKHDWATKGIFPDVLERAFEICCYRFNQNTTAMNYGPKEYTLNGLHQQILNGPADIILPVHSTKDESYGGIDHLEFVEVLKSPGVVVIVDKDSQGLQESALVLQVLSDIWPTVLLAVDLSAISGIFLWILETAKNPADFPRPLHRGAFNGFWWAFVTMSTVGYGDKVPKSIQGRIFAVIWIMFGMIICSTLTATLTSTFDKVNRANIEFELTGKQTGAIEDTQAYYEAIKRGTIVTAFNDFEEIQHALLVTKKIEAILEEIHPATYSLQKFNNPRLTIVKYLESERRYGFVINNERHPDLPGCVRSLIVDRQKDIFMLTSRHLTKAEDITKKIEKGRLEELFDKHKITAIGGICFVSIIVCAVLIQQTYSLWKRMSARKH